MNFRKMGWGVGCGLVLASLQLLAAPLEAHATAAAAPVGAVPAAEPATPAASTGKAPAESKTATTKPSSTGVNHLAIGEPRPSKRLRFRGPNGTCTCDCAAGGISEADIRKAEARRSASR